MYKNEFIALAKLNNLKLQIYDPKLALILIDLNNLQLDQPDILLCTCAICLDSINEPMTLNCGHIFCNDCISALKKAQPGEQKCPLCRAQVKDLILIKDNKLQDHSRILYQKRQIITQGIQFAKQQILIFPQFQQKFVTSKKYLCDNLISIQAKIDSLELQQPNIAQKIQQLTEKKTMLQNIIKSLSQE